MKIEKCSTRGPMEPAYEWDLVKEAGQGAVPNVANVRVDLINSLASSDTIYERQEDRDQQLL